MSPREALEGGETGRFKLPFPTTRNLIKLGKQPSVKAALDDCRARNVVTVTPVMTKTDGGRQLRLRWRPATTVRCLRLAHSARWPPPKPALPRIRVVTIFRPVSAPGQVPPGPKSIVYWGG